MTSSTSRMIVAPSRPLGAIAIACLLGFGLCALPAAAADEPGAITRALGLRTSVPEAPDFVARTRRPGETQFIPVHTPRKGPDGKAMSKSQVESTEKSLDSAARQHDRIAGRKSATRPAKSVAEGMGQGKERAKKDEVCGLTCPNPGVMPTRSAQPRG